MPQSTLASGGPLMNEKGEMIGIKYRNSTTQEGRFDRIGFAVQ